MWLQTGSGGPARGSTVSDPDQETLVETQRQKLANPDGSGSTSTDQVFDPGTTRSRRTLAWIASGLQIATIFILIAVAILATLNPSYDRSTPECMPLATGMTYFSGITTAGLKATRPPESRRMPYRTARSNKAKHIPSCAYSIRVLSLMVPENHLAQCMSTDHPRTLAPHAGRSQAAAPRPSYPTQRLIANPRYYCDTMCMSCITDGWPPRPPTGRVGKSQAHHMALPGSPQARIPRTQATTSAARAMLQLMQRQQANLAPICPAPSHA